MTPSDRTRSKEIPIADLGREYESLRGELAPLLEQVLRGGSYILGEQTREFEKSLAAYCGVREAIGVNSGTDAITLALHALDVGPGDEVLLPAMTFIATAEPVAILGAQPVFVDIHPETFAMDPEAA